ncbi:hypothetical protein [Terrisporobacter sp.]|uniref:hypothetical protein n=1 Tax=Terrisporobacter sp. TaxID=1965305 RepID=UPI002635CA5C|nr:hypothetical protein [Terrisporobacter sp.]
MRNYNDKIFKERSLMFNFIFMLIMFAITQIVGIVICFYYGGMNLIFDMLVMFILNYMLYKALRF